MSAKWSNQYDTFFPNDDDTFSISVVSKIFIYLYPYHPLFVKFLFFHKLKRKKLKSRFFLDEKKQAKKIFLKKVQF